MLEIETGRWRGCATQIRNDSEEVRNQNAWAGLGLRTMLVLLLFDECLCLILAEVKKLRKAATK